jgi:hypothetical protein
MKNMIVKTLAVGAIAMATLSGAANAWCGTPWRRFPPPPPPDWRVNVVLDSHPVMYRPLLPRPAARRLLVPPRRPGVIIFRAQ